MIKYNLNTINGWNFGEDNIIKVYRNNAVCYYKIVSSGGTSGQTPCFAVVDDITQYQETEFVDVYDKATEKWYKLNNLNQYEEYGVYGSGRNITYYEGKLTVDDGYEYIYSGGSWVNVGEVSGSTATLPDVPFTVNYNAKNYDSSTKTLLKTEGQLANVDAVVTAGTPTVSDDYLTIASNTRATISGYQTYFNRDNNNPNLTIISKQNTNGNNCHMFANRDSNYNWMYRCYSNKLTLHGSSETGQLAVTTQPVIESVRINSNRQYQYNNYTNDTTSSGNSFNYGSTNSGKFAIFAGYGTSSGEWFVGDFYWVYMSQNTLTDEQVQQVIAYNEGGGGQPEYPLYYDEMQDPPNNLSFSSMTEAEEYECPWVGMKATIDGVNYVFSGDSQSGYEWVEIISPIPSEYNELEYIEVPRVSRTTTSANLFAVPVDLQAYHKYVLDFTPVNFWDTSYYGVMLGGNNADTNFHDLGIFKLDNGWGTGKMIVSCLNYQLGRTKFDISPYIIQNTRTVISMHMNGYVANNGASISIESNGVEVFTGSSTTKANSSYNPTIGIRNVPLLDMGSSGNNTYTANLKFHNFAVMTSSDELVYNYLPVERISDGQAGLFETVNQVFYPLLGYTVTKGDPV